MLDWRAVDFGLLDEASAHDIGIIARTPLAFGFLTGQFNKQTVFAAADHRSRWSREKLTAWLDAADAIFSALDLPPNHQGRAETALRFCISFDAVATVIPGMLSPVEVLANAAAGEKGPLDPGLMSRIECIYRLHQARLEN